MTTMIDKVRELASASPNFTYNQEDNDATFGCLYSPTPANPQGCIMGAAFQSFGYTVEQLNDIEGTGIQSILGYEHTFDEVSRPLTDDDVEWLGRVQKAQDEGLPWGMAVEYADADPILNNDLMPPKVWFRNERSEAADKAGF